MSHGVWHHGKSLIMRYLTANEQHDTLNKSEIVHTANICALGNVLVLSFQHAHECHPNLLQYFFV
jgi:hypothetical protein